MYNQWAMTKRPLFLLLAVWLGACATGTPSEEGFGGAAGDAGTGAEAGSQATGGTAGEGGDASAGAGGTAGKAGASGSSGAGGGAGSAGGAGSSGAGASSGSAGSGGLDASVDADANADAAPDIAPEVAPDVAPDVPADVAPPCKGKLVGGFCWYLGVSETQHCGLVCGSHGGYNDATRTFAGSSGTNANCQAVLDALGAPGSTVSTLVGSGAGVGCFFMTLASDRYRVADTDTTANATFTLAQRACACNQ